ncbi:molybdenum cofactor guanylyltransferase MobA [Rodentibacter caecimuris]|uniref:Molybdenum cofactor guanylyltransferase n=1 Tax=Rodentibacter caecimuris TaxID=1796644 RepID=A0ABX3KYZ6_9PAST|nr:molybdenum cofactor guanylyltransferase MobA [Rodentibacter heylii]
MVITISAVILAGGLGRRMGGKDKGLVLWKGKPLYQHIADRLQHQPIDIMINANRNQEKYAQSGFPVFADELAGFQGPLSGILTGLKYAKTDYVLFVPCDSPCFPENLLDKLKNALKNDRTLAAYACDLQRSHPTFCLLSTKLIQKLSYYLQSGERKMLQFMQQCQASRVIFDKDEGEFVNFNTLNELEK